MLRTNFVGKRLQICRAVTSDLVVWQEAIYLSATATTTTAAFMFGQLFVSSVKSKYKLFLSAEIFLFRPKNIFRVNNFFLLFDFCTIFEEATKRGKFIEMWSAFIFAYIKTTFMVNCTLISCLMPNKYGDAD